jgi:hypothetical protein
LVWLAGCQVIKAPRGIKSVSAQGVLEAGKSFYVPTGPDGKYVSFPLLKQKEAKGSGKAAADELFAQVGRYQPRIVQGVALETEEQALATARGKGLDYVLYSRVNEWTDANFLTCSPEYVDRLDVDVTVYDVATGRALKIDKLYNGGCPVRVAGIPFGTYSVNGRFRQILDIWLAENLRERR